MEPKTKKNTIALISIIVSLVLILVIILIFSLKKEPSLPEETIEEEYNEHEEIEKRLRELDEDDVEPLLEREHEEIEKRLREL